MKGLNSFFTVDKIQLEDLVSQKMAQSLTNAQRDDDLLMQLQGMIEFFTWDLFRLDNNLNVAVPLSFKKYMELKSQYVAFRHHFEVVKK